MNATKLKLSDSSLPQRLYCGPISVDTSYLTIEKHSSVAEISSPFHWVRKADDKL